MQINASPNSIGRCDARLINAVLAGQTLVEVAAELRRPEGAVCADFLLLLSKLASVQFGTSDGPAAHELVSV
jgi:hypothetical protein